MRNHPREIPPKHSLTIAVVAFVLALLCFALILAGCSTSATGRALNVGVISAGALDLASTRQAMERGAVEANPLMGQSAAQQISVKAAGIGSVLALAALLEQRSLTWAHVARIAAIALQVGVSVHNAGVAR